MSPRPQTHQRTWKERAYHSGISSACKAPTRNGMLALDRMLALGVLVLSAAVAGAPVDRDAVLSAHAAGTPSSEIALDMLCSARRIRQIIFEELGPLERQPTHPEMAVVVQQAVEELGPNYGFNMLLGWLAEAYPDFAFPRRAVANILFLLNPRAAASREQWATRRLERRVYSAHHFMYSVHMDLACKLQEYSLYVGAMIDGDSRMVLKLSAMTMKKPDVVYGELFQPCVEQHGLPDQLITDLGWEVRASPGEFYSCQMPSSYSLCCHCPQWCVAVFACTLVAKRCLRQRRSQRPPHRFVKSVHNVRPPTPAAVCDHSLTHASWYRLQLSASTTRSICAAWSPSACCSL